MILIDRNFQLNQMTTPNKRFDLIQPNERPYIDTSRGSYEYVDTQNL